MMTATITDDEAKIAQLLGEVWNAYLKMPKEHPMEQGEFCTAIHACQDIVLARAGRRALNTHKLSLLRDHRNVESSAICKGDYALGTACGTCSKCIKFDPAKGWELVKETRFDGRRCFYFSDIRNPGMLLTIGASDELDAWVILRKQLSIHTG